VGNGKTVSVSGISITGTDAGNYTFNTTATTTANITPRPLLVSATGVNKVYDGNTTAVVTLSDDRVSGDVLTINYASAIFSDKNVANGKLVSVSGISVTGTDSNNYTFNTTTTTTANITGRPLTITANGVNKVYDGNTTATVTLSDNRVAGDIFTDSYTGASFADKNVANGKTVSVSGISISGTDAGNYTVNTTASTTANITPRPLLVNATGINKVYDGNTAATVTLSDNRVSGDSLTVTYASASFSDKNMGTGKPVSVSGISVSGTDAGNYTFNTTTATTADITGRPLTVTATGINKVYDGNTAATVTLSDNRVSGDVFNDSYTTATFADKNVGNSKTVSVSGISISGADAGNYTFNTTASTTANITGRPLTISATGVNKVYDGNTSATVTLSDNRVSGDVFTDSYASATFANKTVGTGKPVSVSGVSISGTDAGNYTFNTTATTTANITPRPLLVSATGINKVYDGTTTATVTLSDNKVAGDGVTDSYTSATFPDPNVGNGKTVTVAGISITGADAGNYAPFNATTTTTANVTSASTTTAVTGAPIALSEIGQSVTLTATVSAVGPTPTGTVTFKDGTTTLGTGTLNGLGQGTLIKTFDAGSHTITAVYGGDLNHSGSASPAPAITGNVVNGPAGPLQMPASTNISFSFTDSASDSHKCSFAWDDGTFTSLPSLASAASGTCSSSHTFSAAGVYTVGVTVADEHGGYATSMFQFVVVYDPNGAFVTGGGWINSPAGAYVGSGSLTGKANFGFVSKYQKGATVPTGNTEFQFQAGNFNFHSEVYQWLVVSGAKAQYKGTGTVNNAGNYGFLLTATDGEVNGGGGVDKFRIKVWDVATGSIVYDNAPSSSDDINASNQQALGGGSIVIHK